MPTAWDEFESVESTPTDWQEFEPVEAKQDERGRRRVDLLGQMADVERERQSNDRTEQALNWLEAPINPRQLAEGVATVIPGAASIPGVRGAVEAIPPELTTAQLAEAAMELTPTGAALPGIRRSMSQAVAGLASPLNVALAAGGGVATSVPRVGGAIARGIAGGFGADMARHLPETARELGTQYEEAETPEEKQRILSDLALSIGMPAAALAAAIPPRVGTPPRISGVMNAEEAAANRAAVNNMAPGTVRAGERMEWAPPEIAAPDQFQLGEMPFEASRRFGTTKLGEVEVLPSTGRLPAVQILDEPRTLLERETRGKTSFGADAPTLTREALPMPPEITRAVAEAEAIGLNRAAAEAENVARGTRDNPSYRQPKEFTAERAAQQERRAARQSVEEGLTMPEVPLEPLAPDVGQFPEAPGMPQGTLSGLQSSRIQAGKTNVRTNQRNTPPEPITPRTPVEPPKTTESAFEFGYSRRTPEGIAELEAMKADHVRKVEAAKAAKDMNARANLATPGQMIDEALSIAKGEVADRRQAREWLANRELQDLPATAGTARAYELGKQVTTKEALASLKERVAAEEARASTMLESAADDAAVAAASDVGTRAGLLKEAVESSHGMGAGQKFDKTKITPEEYQARMASETPLGEGPTPAASPVDLVSKLEGLKFGTTGAEGKVFSLPHPDAIKAIARQTWDDALDLAIAAVKAGRAVKDAIDYALQHLQKNVRTFDADQIRQNLEYVVSNETKGLSTAAAPGGPTAGAAPARGAVPPAPAAAGAVPPTIPPATRPPAPSAVPPAPAPTVPPRITLDDIYERFVPAPKAGKSVGQVVSEAAEAFKTGFSSRFRPLNKLAEDVAKSYGGTARDVAGIFEQLKGSSGKAEADVYRFDKAVSDLVKGEERDFNAYLMLRRSIDRLQQDVASGETRRGVSAYTIPELQSKLAQLESNIGPARVSNFKAASDAFQTHLDQALQLQVTSGRMPIEVYEAIKDGNQFYAPFKIMKYVEETMRPEGSGRRVDTMADLTKAMEGIEDPNFKLGDMLPAARQSIVMSRILAEKNKAMSEITQLAAMDTGELMIKKLGPQQDAPKGMDVVNVLENGKQVRYAVDKTVADAVAVYGSGAASMIARAAAGTFRLGATTFNLPFQVSNLLADLPRAAFVSKYGVNGVRDLVTFPMDVVHGLYSAIAGNVFGHKNKLFMDFLDSGAAGTTVQKYLTPDALEFKPVPSKTGIVRDTLNTVAHFADAIEQTSKVVGIKRAIKSEGKTSGKELAIDVPEAVTEVRRFSGSPDFGRMGKWVDQYRLNLLYMFLNARIQGTVADMGRLLGRDGAGTAAKTWGKVGVPVGLATAYLAWLNNSDDYKEDFAKRSEQEKRNYWLIPKDTFITSANGEKMRDYWRIPKREIAKWTANIVESGLDFARERDPQALADWGTAMAEELIPVNVQGDTMQERMESVGASLNPIIKAPLEVATGRDMYRHKPIVPDTQKKASPELQFTDRTPAVFKQLAEAMPDVAPEAFRSPLMLENMAKNFTAGLFTQFLPRKPVEGRSKLENTPLLQRFQAIPFSDDTEFRQQVDTLEREAADEQLTRYRQAQALVEDNKGKTPAEIMRVLVEKHGRDAKLAQRTMDLYVAEKNGVTAQERRVLALPSAQRAAWVADFLRPLDGPAKAAAIQDMARKRILTEAVAAELVKLQTSTEGR